MRTPTRTHWIVAAGVAAALAVGGCSRSDDTRTSANVDGQTAGGQPQTNTPPPGYAEQIEQRLVALGAKQADQGLVLMIDAPVADASQGKSGQATAAAAAPGTDAIRAEAVERVAELLDERPELQVEIRGDSAAQVASMLKERRASIAPDRIRTGDATDRGPLQFVLADAQGRFQSRLGGGSGGDGRSGDGGGGRIEGTASPAAPAGSGS